MIAGDDSISFFLPSFSFLTNVKEMNIMWGKDISFGSISFRPRTWVEWWEFAEIYWDSGKSNWWVKIWCQSGKTEKATAWLGWGEECVHKKMPQKRAGHLRWCDCGRNWEALHVVEAVGVHLYQLMAHNSPHFLASRHGHMTGFWPMSF